jgi:outer membrane protein TolC
MQENRVLKTEINLLRENEARNEQLREGNEELLQERRGLISRIEQMEKEYQESTTNFAEKEQQHEELRSRITVIAELFEKKPIS